MFKRTVVITVVVLIVAMVGASVLSAQANCPDPTACPLGLQNGPMANGRGNSNGNGMQQNGPAGNGWANGTPQGGRMMFGQQNGPAMNGRGGQGANGGPMAGYGQGSYIGLPAASSVPPSAEVIDAMTSGYLDEVNAAAVYAAIIDQFGELRPFTNIAAAEQQHSDAWAFLFDRYGLDLPELTPTVTVPEFATVTDACRFALDAEVGNAALYDTMLATFTDYPDITQIVTSLRDASEQNHNSALQNCISR